MGLGGQCETDEDSGMTDTRKYLNEHPEAVAPLVALGLWALIWKAFALYRAGANRSPGWFTAILLVNSLGLLEMSYLFVFGTRKRATTRLLDRGVDGG